MQIIRRSSFSAVPWKNGGGVTHEVIRVGSGVGGDGFDWRLSVADIAVPGPFSVFAGYHRIMALLRGGGVRLSFPTGDVSGLAAVGDVIEFDGAHAPQCELVDGACTDLNLMVCQATTRAAARVYSLSSLTSLPDVAATRLLFPLSGAIVVRAAEGVAWTLDAWDSSVAAPGQAVTLAPADASAVVLVFSATITGVADD